MAYMHKSDAPGWAPNDVATAMITGTLVFHGEHVVMVTNEGTTVPLPKGTVLAYTPGPSRIDLRAFDEAGR